MDDVKVLPELPIAEFLFKFQAIDEITLPEYPGTLWHGVFGRALREQVCVVPDEDCKQCMLKHHCDYAYLFQSIRPENSKIMKKYDSVPSPFLFSVNNSNSSQISPDSFFLVKAVVVGRASEKIPIIIRSMMALGVNGFGKRRARAKLIMVSQSKPDEIPTLIFSDNRLLNTPTPYIPAIPPKLKTVRIEFNTPYKQTGKSNQNENLDLGKLLMMIVRRTSLLQYFYTKKSLDVDYVQLKNETNNVQVIDANLYWQKSERYSTKQKKSIDTGGWLGSVDIKLENIENLWAFLTLGQWLGVGKNSSMGFGRYTLMLIE